MNKVIVSDTSCLIALSKVEELDLLKAFFNEVIITSEVMEEFGGALPDWIVTRDAKNIKKIKGIRESS